MLTVRQAVLRRHVPTLLRLLVADDSAAATFVHAAVESGDVDFFATIVEQLLCTSCWRRWLNWCGGPRPWVRLKPSTRRVVVERLAAQVPVLAETDVGLTMARVLVPAVAGRYRGRSRDRGPGRSRSGDSLEARMMLQVCECLATRTPEATAVAHLGWVLPWLRQVPGLGVLRSRFVGRTSNLLILLNAAVCWDKAALVQHTLQHCKVMCEHEAQDFAYLALATALNLCATRCIASILPMVPVIDLVDCLDCVWSPAAAAVEDVCVLLMAHPSVTPWDLSRVLNGSQVSPSPIRDLVTTRLAEIRRWSPGRQQWVAACMSSSPHA